MRKLAPLFALAGCFLFAAPHVASAQGNSRVYIMMKNGKLTEVVNGKAEAVTRDVILPNHATVHTDGTVDDKDGNAKKINEGEYISFVDGRIRKLSASPAATTSTATTGGTSTTGSSTRSATHAKSTTPAKKATP